MMKVFVRKITNLKNLKKNTQEVFKFLELKSLGGKRVVIKPNWVAPRTAQTGVTTDLRQVEAVIVELKRRKAKILIAESAGYEFDPITTNRILEADSLARRYKIPLINTRSCRTRVVNIGGRILKKIRLPREVLEADLIINLPKLKTHMLTEVSFSLKNLFGFLPLEERRRAHTYGIHQAIVDLASFFMDKTLVMVDGMVAMGGTGPVFGNVIKPNVLIASENLLAADLACCRLTRVNYKKVDHLRLAKEQIGLDKLEIVGARDFKIKNFETPKFSKFYRLGYRSVFALEEFLKPIFKGLLVAQIVTRFGTRPQIDKEKVKAKDKERLINTCPVGAISEDLEIDFEKCRQVRCLRCYDKFPEVVKLRGISKPRK